MPDAMTLEVLSASFFFVDTIGLSDPSVTADKQTVKIRVLNELVGSCDAFFLTPEEQRIVLPTGDGMAIGFLLNPELPLQLSMQLHKKLRTYNKGKSEEDLIKVRIGLSSGPVFVLNDINNNQNLWGPGIVIARRVMDIGDSWHILLESKLAEELMSLKDEYRKSIKPLNLYKIKHGQEVRIFSAHSDEFGNPNPPARIFDRSRSNLATG